MRIPSRLHRNRHGVFGLRLVLPAQFRDKVHAYPGGEISEIELAVDFHPRATPTRKGLSALHAELRHALIPQRFFLLNQAKRSYIQGSKTAPKKDVLGPCSSDRTIYYRQRDRRAEVKLYVKRRDQKRKVKRPWVRVELRLDRGGCQYARVNRFGKLPAFLSQPRKFVQAFALAEGAKFMPRTTKSKNPLTVAIVGEQNKAEAARLERRYTKYGAYALWLRRLATAPDAVGNRRVGQALQGLRDRFEKVRIDPKLRKEIEQLMSDDDEAFGFKFSH